MRLLATLITVLFTFSLAAARAHHKEHRLVDICDYRDGKVPVVFTEPTEPNLILAIVTKWYSYAHELDAFLTAAGFEPVTRHHKKILSVDCRFKHLADVSKGGIKRGVVAYTYDVSHPNDDSRVPSRDTVNRVKAVLSKHAPTHDILEIVFVALSPLVAGLSFITLLFILYNVAVWVWPDKHDVPEDIEMTSFRTTYPAPSITETLPPYPESVKDRYSVVSTSPGKKFDSVTVQA